MKEIDSNKMGLKLSREVLGDCLNLAIDYRSGNWWDLKSQAWFAAGPQTGQL